MTNSRSFTVWEAYLVDDTKDIVENAAGQSLDDKYVVFDIETTGFSPEKNKIIEIGAVEGNRWRDCRPLFHIYKP